MQRENKNRPTIWALTSGAAGMRSQVLGLAHAIGGEISEKQASLRKPWSLLPGHLCPNPLTCLTNDSSQFSPPWPDILITCGRRSSALSIAIAKKSKGKTFRVHIQDPQISSKYFDMVIAMQHDDVTGDNIISTKTALHNIRQTELEDAKNLWREQLPLEQTDLVLGIILGGKNKKFGFSEERLRTLMNLIKKAREAHNATILITPSRRTEAFVKSALQEIANKDSNIWLWDELKDNPYHAILSLSDHLCVTADSVSMISECLYTAKPVHIYPLSGTSRRHGIFLTNLVNDNLVSLIDREIDFSVNGLNQPIDETGRIAEIIRKKMSIAPKG